MTSEARWRTPSAVERKLIETVLRGDYPGREILADQIGNARVADDCGCGCMSVRFEIAPDSPRLPESWQQEFAGVDRAGGSHSLFFHAFEDGRVHCLDHVRWDEQSDAPLIIESLRVCDQDPSGRGAWNVVPHVRTIIEESRDAQS